MKEAKQIRILLVDDHTLFRESLRRLLEAESRYTVIAEVASTKEAMEICRGELAFDVALIDYDLGPSAGPQGGLSVLRCLRMHRDNLPALMITAGIQTNDLATIVQDLRAGVFLKTDPAAELLVALQRTLRGEIWLSSGVGLSIVATGWPEQEDSDGRMPALEARERVVLQMIVEGLSNKEIGVRLNVSESAVKAVLQRLFQKVGVRTRAQLVRFAFESELGLP